MVRMLACGNLRRKGGTGRDGDQGRDRDCRKGGACYSAATGEAETLCQEETESGGLDGR